MPATGIGEAEELGDLLFAVANVARKADINAEEALQDAVSKFSRRFALMEAASENGNKKLREMTMDELEELWQTAKKALKP